MNFLTVAKTESAEFTAERSRFIGHCREVVREDEAKTFIARIRGEHFQATHNCYAYRIGAAENPLEYYHDHGEPSGTAGKPILGAIQKLNLTNTVVVVTRYFGGKKLGVRGLIEAYGKSAALVLEKAGAITRILRFTVVLNYHYTNHSLILHRLQQVQAEVTDTKFTDKVTATIAIPEMNRQSFMNLINELPVEVLL